MIIAQTAVGGLPVSTIVVGVIGALIVLYTWWSGRDLANRRHNPSRKRTGAGQTRPLSGCECPQPLSKDCVPAHVVQHERKPYVVYLHAGDCCGDDRITADDLQAIVDQDEEAIGEARRKRLAERLRDVLADEPPKPKRRAK